MAIKKCFNIFQSLSDAKKIAREVRLLRQMNHPNITRIITVGRKEGKEGGEEEGSVDIDDQFLWSRKERLEEIIDRGRRLTKSAGWTQFLLTIHSFRPSLAPRVHTRLSRLWSRPSTRSTSSRS